MRRLLLALFSAALVAALLLPAGARAAAPYVINGYSVGNDTSGHPDVSLSEPIAAWQGKRTGVVSVFGGVSAIETSFEKIWAAGSIPMLSYYPSTPNWAMAAGAYDGELYALMAAFRTFVDGPDGKLDTADDRRAYLRYAWEPNHHSYAYSPCSTDPTGGGTAGDYVNAWRRAHGIFRSGGVRNTHVAWVYSVTIGNRCVEGKAERTYPGSAYVDWFGMNGYDVCGAQTVDQAFGNLTRQLRALDPGKPISITEAGVSSYLTVAHKSAWIRSFFTWSRDNDIRMALWFNLERNPSTDCKHFEKPWAFFGPRYGDETVQVGDQAYKAYSAYREALADPAVIGTDASDSRLLTDAQFLGLDAPAAVAAPPTADPRSGSELTEGATATRGTAGSGSGASPAERREQQRREQQRRRRARGARVRSALGRQARRYRPAGRRAR